jgi:hypothetical protein
MPRACIGELGLRWELGRSPQRLPLLGSEDGGNEGEAELSQMMAARLIPDECAEKEGRLQRSFGHGVRDGYRGEHGMKPSLREDRMILMLGK